MPAFAGTSVPLGGAKTPADIDLSSDGVAPRLISGWFESHGRSQVDVPSAPFLTRHACSEWGDLS